MLISSKIVNTIKLTIRRKNGRMVANKRFKKKFKKRKIEDMEQDKQVICTISKYCSHTSTQALETKRK